MYFRSKLSQEKDQFNFAFMLIHDLQEFVTSDCISLTPKKRLQIIGICIRLTYRGVVAPKDLSDIEFLLGKTKASRLRKITINKARLETDFVNS